MPPNNKQRNGQTPPSTVTPATPQLSEDLIRDILANQKQEIALKQQELIIRDREIQQAHELSIKTLEAQKQLLLDAPNHSFKHHCLLYGTIIFIVLLVGGVFVYCLHSGNKEIAMRIIELLATAVISGGGGYALGKNKKDKPQNNTVEVVE